MNIFNSNQKTHKKSLQEVTAEMAQMHMNQAAANLNANPTKQPKTNKKGKSILTKEDRARLEEKIRKVEQQMKKNHKETYKKLSIHDPGKV